jgi:hypothetical protein
MISNDIDHLSLPWLLVMNCPYNEGGKRERRSQRHFGSSWHPTRWGYGKMSSSARCINDIWININKQTLQSGSTPFTINILTNLTSAVSERPMLWEWWATLKLVESTFYFIHDF